MTSSARGSPGRTSAGAPESELCRGFRSTSWARLSCAAFQIHHRSASECLVWFTNPTGNAFGCPPHPSRAKPSTSFQEFLHVALPAVDRYREDHFPRRSFPNKIISQEDH